MPSLVLKEGFTTMMGEACWRDFEKIQEMTSLYKKPLAAN